MAVRIEREAEPIPGYKLLERIGGGGFGEVWKATAPGGLLKAIKFVYGDLQTTTEEGQRAEQELKALSRVKTVRHPYILSLERYDIIDGQLIIVMELADRNLWDRFRECKSQGLAGIPREELLRYMEESAEALDLMNTLHQLQHLDIKPQNLFLVHNHAKVADFGLVKDLQGVMASVTGGITPVYAAPETYDGWISRFCDQYSLAIVYQELLTGQRPFSGTNVRQLILQHMEKAPNLAPLPPCDRAVIGRALAKNPDERFPTCQEFILALRQGNPASVGQPETAEHDGQQDLVPALSPFLGRAGVQAQPEGMVVLEEESELDPDSPAVAESTPSEDSTQWIRFLPELRPADTLLGQAPPPEVQGDGALFPALVVGLGSLGLGALQRLREQITEQFGTVEALPQIRLLYLDTDPETARLATRGGPTAALAPNEVLLAKLHRPSYYLRSKHARACIDSWINQRMLYRIPRTPETTGLRALGRLAFFDNYPLIARRLTNELKACMRPDSLTTAAKQTGLGLRSNRPRIYVVTGLGGGTGGGMFLDLAYVLRNLLKQRGYAHPEIIGLFLVPPVDNRPGRALSLGNTFAALTELHHFSSPRTIFSAQYEERNHPLQDVDAPYSRFILLPLPEGADEAHLDRATLASNKATTLVGDLLFNYLASPLGRTADESRAIGQGDRGTPTRHSHPITFETFGLYRISWPRRALLHNVARRLCGRIVQTWMAKDAAPVRNAVGFLIPELWAQQQASGEHLMAELQQACEQALSPAPEAAFEAATEPLAQMDMQTLDQLPAVLKETLHHLEQLVGRPDISAGAQPPAVAEVLGKTADRLIAEQGEQVVAIVAGLIELPDLRLAGAEEAVRQLIAILEQELQHFEPLANELSARAAEAYSRIGPLVASLQGGLAANKRLAPAFANLLELLRVYPKWRYQSLILHRVVAICVSLRGRLSDQLREIHFCRSRLGELLRSFENPSRDAVASDTSGNGRNIYPAGCRTLDEAIQQVLQTVSAEEFRDLDARIQELLQQRFKGLGHVCLTPVNLLDTLEAAMRYEAELFVETRLAGVNIADMYLAQQEKDEKGRQELAAAFKQAVPQITARSNGQQPEISILGAPAGKAGERIRAQTREALPEVRWAAAATREDIVFYREIPRLPLSDLEQLGTVALEAYRQMSAVEHFTPHSRTDIQEWRAASVIR